MSKRKVIYNNKQVHSNLNKVWLVVCYHYPTFEDYLKFKGFNNVTEYNHLLLSFDELMNKVKYHSTKVKDGNNVNYHSRRVKYFKKLLLTV